MKSETPTPPRSRLEIEAGEGYEIIIQPYASSVQPGYEPMFHGFKSYEAYTWGAASTKERLHVSPLCIYRRKLPPVDPDREERERIAREDEKTVEKLRNDWVNDPTTLHDGYDLLIKAIHTERRAIAGMLDWLPIPAASRLRTCLEQNCLGHLISNLESVAVRLSVDGRAEGEKV